MTQEQPALLTTGQAAKLCSVTPDTVLKWIKKGRLTAHRTAGGHFRIERRDLEPFMIGARNPVDEAVSATEAPPSDVPCWEYLGNGEEIQEACRQCVVYRVRATRCFLMAGMEPEVGHARQFCEGSCEDCVYYRRIQGLDTKVLFITSDDELIQRLGCAEDQGVVLRFAMNPYEASAVIQDFRPAFVVIDVERTPSWDSGLLDSLATDSRLPGVKIILLVPPGMADWRRRQLHGGPVVSVLEKPVGCTRIVEAISDSLDGPQANGKKVG